MEDPVDQMTAYTFIMPTEAQVADQHGIQVPSGWTTITFHQAAAWAADINRALAGGVCYARQGKALCQLRDALIRAFGPEGEAEFKAMNQEGRA